MKFKVFLIFLFSFFLDAKIPMQTLQGDCNHPKNFTKDQKSVILRAYHYGNKKDFGYTMAAIAWQESCAGKYLLNFSDPSAGIYHALIPVVIKKYSKLKNTSFNRNLVGQILIENHDFASQVALEQLLEWEKIFKKDYKKIIKSYHKGTAWKKNQASNQKAERYFKDIQEKIRLLKLFIPQFLAEERMMKIQKPSVFKKVDTIPSKETKFYLLSE